MGILLWLGLAPDSEAQSSRFAIELGGGTVFPFSPLDRTAVEASNLRREGGGQVADVHLVDRYGKLSLLLSAGLLLDQVEVRYQRESWIRGRQRLLCTGEEPAWVRSDTTIDDRAVRYRCGGGDDDQVGRPDRRPAVVHRLEAGLRSDLWTSDTLHFWWAAGGGAALTSTTRDASILRFRPGLSANGGLGLDILVPNSQFAIVLEARYRFLVLGAGTGFQSEAHRAVAADRGATSALLDIHHAVQSLLLLRVAL